MRAACRGADPVPGFRSHDFYKPRTPRAGTAGLVEADLMNDRLAGWTIAESAVPVSTD